MNSDEYESGLNIAGSSSMHANGKNSLTCCNVVKNRTWQCCADHIVQGCQQW